MSSFVKNESPEPLSMKSEPLEETVATFDDTTNTSTEPVQPPQCDSPSPISRRPCNPFILFRTWYIKQGHLKPITSSGSELSKITGKLWKAMHEDDRKFWAQQSKLEREASQGRTYAPAAAPRPRGSRSRKKAAMSSSIRYDPMAVRAPDPIDERMDNIVQLIIAGKTGEEIGGELRNQTKPSTSSSPPTGSPLLPLLAPVPRSARASVSVDALELQSHLSSSFLEHESLKNSLSPPTSLNELPDTPEHHMSGYSTPLEQAPEMRTRTLGQWGDQVLPLNATPEFSFAPSLHGRSDSLDTESWSTAGTPDASAVLYYPVPADHKEAPQLVYPQGWEYCNVPAPYYGLNCMPTGYGMPNYTSHSLAPSTSGWRGPELVSPYDVPGHAHVAHTGDLVWPPEWVNDSY
ncbi:hypothetical protein FRC12_020476 [Ceratobasidium sp. 428]|nr:hypothetical protein FRC12_020476 [Ceratobasidium sp. 428]